MRNKFYARKRKKDGMVFDSSAEMRRWVQLQKMEKEGKITDLRRQVKFVLIPYQQKRFGDVIVYERECSYIADFVYIEDGQQVVEDVKGNTKGIAYQYFVIKRKLMLERYGISIREVKM
jgi:hypothetical protein